MTESCSYVTCDLSKSAGLKEWHYYAKYTKV